MTSADPRHTHYQTLMLAENVDEEIVSTVYRKFAQRYHPDVDGSPEAARRMAEINDAYATLKDPEKRRRYDHWLASRRDRRRADRLIVTADNGTYGTAGTPTGPAQGSVVDFGRYSGWTLGQIKRHDPGFLEWLMRVPAGQRYRIEIHELLAKR